tara:strand:- start:906 stop:1235 length:330 start_codon:yes stop_codon:yes gene_type:complete
MDSGPTTTAGLIAGISMGEWDEGLRTIAQAVADRRRVVAEQENAESFASLAVGDTVKLGDIRPKYMVGLVGEVIDLNRGKATLRCTESRRRFHEGDEVRVHAACCQKIG